MDSCQLLRPKRIDVFLQRTQTPWILLNEIGGRRTARQRLQTKRTRAGVQIEDSRIGNVQLKDAHPRFAHAIKRRSNVHAFWCAYSSPSPATGDYAQGAGGGRGWAGSWKWEAGSGKRILFTLDFVERRRFV